jgi:hypothetical protein
VTIQLTTLTLVETQLVKGFGLPNRFAVALNVPFLQQLCKGILLGYELEDGNGGETIE